MYVSSGIPLAVRTTGIGRNRLSGGKRIAVIKKPSFSDLGLFRDLERVVDLDSEVLWSKEIPSCVW